MLTPGLADLVVKILSTKALASSGSFLNSEGTSLGSNLNILDHTSSTNEA